MTAETLLPTVLSGTAASAHQAVARAGALAPQDAADLADLLATDVVLAARSWDRLRAMLDAGAERSRLRANVAALGGAVSAVLAFGRLLGQIAPHGGTPAADVEANLARLGAIADAVASLAAWLDAPRPPIDPERLARGIGQGQRGEVVNADEFLARLRAGEEP
jgi:hypothetical protein